MAAPPSTPAPGQDEEPIDERDTVAPTDAPERDSGPDNPAGAADAPATIAIRTDDPAAAVDTATTPAGTPASVVSRPADVPPAPAIPTPPFAPPAPPPTPPAPPARVRRRPPLLALLLVLLLAAGTGVAVVAVVQASTFVLLLAGLLLVAGVVVAAVLARRRIERPWRRLAVVAGAVVLALLVLAPASMNVDPCPRVGRGADLSGCDLSGDDLAGEDLSDADLSGTDLHEADLSGADLTGADLGEADLRDATATEADLTGTTLAGADLGGSDLTGAKLNEVDLSGADLTGAVLGTARIHDAVLSGATLAGTDLAGADLTRSDLTGADLSGADLTDVRAADAVFDDADLTEATLRSNYFGGATGLTDETVAAALGVPIEDLPVATKLRGIEFDSYEVIVDSVRDARDGEAVPEARPYSPSDAFHPTLVLDAGELEDASWLADVVDRWAPTGLRYAELVVVVLPEGRELIETCTGYVFDDGSPAPPTERYVTSITVRLLSANTAQTVAEQTFRGADPRQCQEEERTNEIYGDPPDLDALAQPWLADLVNPPAPT